MKKVEGLEVCKPFNCFKLRDLFRTFFGKDGAGSDCLKRILTRHICEPKQCHLSHCDTDNTRQDSPCDEDSTVFTPRQVKHGLLEDVVDDEERPLEVRRPDRETAIARPEGHRHVVGLPAAAFLQDSPENVRPSAVATRKLFFSWQSWSRGP